MSEPRVIRESNDGYKSASQIGEQYNRIAMATRENELYAARGLDMAEAVRQKERRERAREIAARYQGNIAERLTGSRRGFGNGYRTTTDWDEYKDTKVSYR